MKNYYDDFVISTMSSVAQLLKEIAHEVENTEMALRKDDLDYDDVKDYAENWLKDLYKVRRMLRALQ